MPEASAIKDQNPDYVDDNEEGKLGCCDDGADSEAENCCGKSLRCWLVTANLITLLVGLTEIVMGILVQVMPEWSFAGGSVGWLIIITGLFLFLVSFLGVFAGCKGARADCWMYTYALVITIVFGLQIAAVIVAGTSVEDFSNAALTKMEEAWTQHTTDANKEYLGLQFGCCSATDTNVIGTGEKNASCILRNDFGSNGAQTTQFGGICDVYPICVDLIKDDISSVTDVYTNSNCAQITYVNASANCPVSGAWVANYGADDCAAYKESAAMPSCTSDATFDKVWYTTFAGALDKNKITLEEVTDDSGAKKQVGLNASFVNCYGRIESFIAANKDAAVAGIVIYILWQLLLVLFSWMLACDCCNKKENIEDSAVNKDYPEAVNAGV